MIKTKMRYVASADWGYGCRIAFLYRTKGEAVEGIKSELLKELPNGETGCWEVHTLDGMVVERGTLRK